MQITRTAIGVLLVAGIGTGAAGTYLASRQGQTKPAAIASDAVSLADDREAVSPTEGTSLEVATPVPARRSNAYTSKV